MKGGIEGHQDFKRYKEHETAKAKRSNFLGEKATREQMQAVIKLINDWSVLNLDYDICAKTSCAFCNNKPTCMIMNRIFYAATRTIDKMNNEKIKNGKEG